MPFSAHKRQMADESAERRLERETGFEPATSTLARSHSTTELLPLGNSNISNLVCAGQLNGIAA